MRELMVIASLLVGANALAFTEILKYDCAMGNSLEVRSSLIPSSESLTPSYERLYSATISGPYPQQDIELKAVNCEEPTESQGVAPEHCFIEGDITVTTGKISALIKTSKGVDVCFLTDIIN